jgi:hypothetical protein
MYGFHIQSVAQDERNLVFAAEIGDPIPGKHAFYADNQILKVGEYDIEKQLGIGVDILVHPGFTTFIKNANVHFSCMKIDTTIEFVLLIVKSHDLPPFFVKCVNDVVSITYTFR